MSESHLPEDIRQWPSDPQRLLNVTQDVGSRELRRAYTRLIRKFKPEHFPEEFRRIRDAYESLQYMAEYRDRFASSADEAAESSVGDAAADGNLSLAAQDNKGHGRTSGLAELLEKTLDQELEEVWEQTCRGEEQPAYSRLLELAQRHGASESICVRLYWLLKISPELDAKSDRTKWLFTKATSQSGSYALRDLFRREVEKNPELAFVPEFAGLLGRDAPGEVVYDLLSIRWRAAARYGRWQVIEEDLRRLTPKLENSDPHLLIRLQANAAETLLWNPSRAPVALLAAIDNNPHFQLEMQAVIDRLELISQLALEWRELLQREGNSNYLVKWLAALNQEPVAVSERQLLEIAARFVTQPESHFQYLETLHVQFPLVLLEVCQRMGCLAPHEDPKDELSLLRIREFFVKRPSQPYPSLRKDLLRFCIQEHLLAENVAQAIEDWPSLRHRGGEDTVSKLQVDLPLRCILAANAAITYSSQE